MLYLFNEPSFHRARMYSIPSLTMLHKKFLPEHAKLQNYLIARKFILPSDHVLVNIVKNMNVSFKRDLVDYVECVYDKVPSLESMYKLSSSMQHTLPSHKTYFYNPGCKEIIISVREYFDINEAMANWKTMEPIRVMSHPFTDISYTPIVGKYVSGNNQGIAYIYLDITKLMFQYRMWVRDCLKNNRNVESVDKFLIDYPLFNMSKSHMNVTMFNRAYNLLMNKPNDPFNLKVGIALLDVTKDADNALKPFLAQIIKSPVRFDEIIQNFPVAYGEFIDCIALPDMARTRQIKPILLASRLKIFEFLLTVNSLQGGSVNRSWLSKISVELKYLDTENILTFGLLDETNERIRTIKRLLAEVGY